MSQASRLWIAVCIVLAAPAAWAGQDFRPLPAKIRAYFPVGIEFAPGPGFTAVFRRATTKGYRTVLTPDPSGRARLTNDQELCWDTILSGGSDCDATIPPPGAGVLRAGAAPAQLDLLLYGREISKANGMRAARDWIEAALPSQDESRGMLETRMMETTRDLSYTYPDSFLALPPEQRARIAILFVAGFNYRGGDSVDIMERAQRSLVALGFRSEVVPIGVANAAGENARVIRDTIVKVAPGVDHIVIASLSKGTNDFSHFVIDYMSSLPPETQNKLDAIVSLSGAIRDVFVARWLMDVPGPTTAFLRRLMLTKLPPDDRTLEGIATVGTDPWWPVEKGNRVDLPGRDHLLWINFAMIPNSELGFPEHTSPYNVVDHLALASGVDVGPYDGLVETGASILPPGMGYHQWIVRARGDHGLVGGVYLDGTPVSRVYSVKGCDDPQEGAEIMDSFLRALPVSILH